MCVNCSWWIRQFADALRKLVEAYEEFKQTREVEYLDEAMVIHEDICAAYSLGALDLLGLVEIGKSLRARQALHTLD